MNRNSQSPQRPVTAQDLMKVCLRSYFANNDRFFVPDWTHAVEGFDTLLEHWRSFSTMCPETQHDDVRNGTWFCSKDDGHQGNHFGGLSVATTTTTTTETGMGVA